MTLFPSILVASLALAPAAPAPRPRLVVVVSVDQCSAELMERWGKGLPGGLGRLYREGTTFLDAYQAHGGTETGPGHAVLLTGRHPTHTGIIANQWRDHATGAITYCVEDSGQPLLGSPEGGASARFLTGTTLGDWLQRQVPGSRMFAMTGKDRAAILMAGPRAAGVYWFAGPAGFTTSTAYAPALPAWLEAYDRRFLGGLAGGPLAWTPKDPKGLPPGGAYQIAGQTVTMGLPRTILAAGAPLDKEFWMRFRASPFFDHAILGAAEALEEGEGLGSGPGVDVLALGLSATDYVGHAFGNAGPEMLDHLRRLDQDLGQFLDPLLARVPGTWVVLTADHGAADFPERRAAQGLPGRRMDPAVWVAGVNETLRRQFPGAGKLLLPLVGDQVSLDPEAVRRSGHLPAELLPAAAQAILAAPGVEAVFRADQLQALPVQPASPDHTSLEQRERLSFRAGRTGDLVVVFKPFTVLGATVGQHGSPHDYDRRVPLIFWGPWRAELRHEPVSLVDLAPTLARELGLVPGEPLDGAPLALHPAH